MRPTCLLLIISFCSFIVTAQQVSLAEKLGLPADAKMLIMHADDLGVSHSVNAASIRAMEEGTVSSSSIMVPCPWFSEIAEYASQNPGLCWGLHLTLNSEWKYYKWDGVSPSSEIPTLLNESGHFYDNVMDFVENADLTEVEREVRAQIEHALAAGVPVSHLDSHMGALFANKDLFAIYVRLGNEYNLPVMIPGNRVPPSWMEGVDLGPVQYPLSMLSMFLKPTSDWTASYNDLLAQVKPGLNEIIIHLGYDDDEMKAIMVDHPDYGATWRQKDFDYVMSTGYRQKLKEYDIQLVSYRQIKKVLKSNP